MSVSQLVGEKIISLLKKGEIPWKKPWFGKDWAVSHLTGKRYSLLNQILLGEPGEYLTFNQVKKLGGKVKAGEKAKMLVYYDFVDEKDEKGELTGNVIPFLRRYSVFNINQTEGIKNKYQRTFENVPIEELEKVANGYLEKEGIKLINGDSAYYAQLTDLISVPCITQFKEIDEYYSTLYHEMVHSTGSKKRLARKGIVETDGFGGKTYAEEELIAEIGSASLLHSFGHTETIKNSAAYCQSWLKSLENNPAMIVSAANKAEKALKYILGGEYDGEQNESEALTLVGE